MQEANEQRVHALSFPTPPIQVERCSVSFHYRARVPDFTLELVREALSKWHLSAIERSGISSPTCPAVSTDGDGSKQVRCLMTDGVQALHIYDVFLLYSFVILSFFRLLFIQIGMCFVPLVLCL